MNADEVADLQAKFAHFAAHACPEDPLYAAVSVAVAAEPEWAALLAAAPPTQRSPTLWFAALHDRLMEVAETGATASPLAAYFPSLGGARTPDGELPRHLGAFLSSERDALRARIRTQATQTNEIGRCAVLWLILRRLAVHTGLAKIALLDVGSSAGLNLGVDRWHYRYVDDLSGRLLGQENQPPADTAGETPSVTCRVVSGSAQLFDSADLGPHLGISRPALVSALGIDPQPVDVSDPVAVRWLRACLWPYDAARRERFEAAVAVARSQSWRVRPTPAAGILEAIAQWLDSVPEDTLAVVFNSWVLAYFEPDALHAHVSQLQRWIVGVPGRPRPVWISAEPPALTRQWWAEMPEAAALPPGASVSTAELAQSTAWSVALPAEHASIARWLAARSHAHGRWLQWAGGPS